jgi:hypothetical protein
MKHVCVQGACYRVHVTGCTTFEHASTYVVRFEHTARAQPAAGRQGWSLFHFALH